MFARFRLVLFTVFALGLSVLLGACGSSKMLSQPATWLTPYRPDVVQGNFISSEQVALLNPGLSRLQVRNLLGTPLVSSLFHADRWDYVFSMQRRVGESRIYRYAVFFKGDELTRFEGDRMPSEAEFIAQLDVRRELGKVPALEATAEQLKAAQANSPPRSTESAAAAASAPTAATSYPPLEGRRP
jgi:outer membrane protein assembly factor BamE